MAKVKKLADFREQHDKSVIVPKKIKAALDAMAKESPENWEYEADFLKRAGVANPDIGKFRDQFKGHIVDVTGRNPKRVWVATVKAADKFRASLG